MPQEGRFRPRPKFPRLRSTAADASQTSHVASVGRGEGETQMGSEGLGSVDSNLPFRHAPGGTPTNFLNARLKAASDS